MIQDGPEAPNWRRSKTQLTAEILLSDIAVAGWERLAPSLTGFDLRLTAIDPAQDVPESILQSDHLLILEVRRDSQASLERLVRVVKARPAGTVIAALRDPSVSDARSLLKAGAADILSLPLEQSELEASLARIRAEIEAGSVQRKPNGRIVSAIKSVGGVGATGLLTQLASIHATREREHGRDTCFIDLDIQFGSAALYLGSLPALGLQDLIGAGGRADGAMLRTTAAQHASGLSYIAAPGDLLPLETVDEDQIAAILDLATREFSSVFLDLPPSWTNWSLSAVARSDLILLVTNLSVAGLHQARRQIEFMRQQGLTDTPVRIVANRVERKMFKSVDLKDAARVLGREVDFAVAEDAETVGSALDQGVSLADISARSRATRDVTAIADALAKQLAGAA